MSIYHCSIKIISRVAGRSAVASAAYRSGEKLYNNETGITHDFTSKRGVVYSEIILPPNAPPQYAKREVLWNEVQRIESRIDAQVAREVEVAFPVEMTIKEQLECVRKFIMKNFVSQGMIADFAIHDKGDGNPHAHIMLTVRGIDANSKWMQKQKTVFANAFDDLGRPIYDPTKPSYNPQNKAATSQYRIPMLDAKGRQKVRVRKGKGTEYLWEKISIPINDWNDHSKAEIWRASWAEECNKYLAPENQIDHRSFERQGIELTPTIHEGVTARQMEAKGKISDRCQINRDIRKINRLMKEVTYLAKEITKLITEKLEELYGRVKRVTTALANSKNAGRDDITYGRTGTVNRKSREGNSGIVRATGRITAIKRGVAETEQNITATAERIKEIKQLISEKEAIRDARIRRIMERRETSRGAGRTARGNRDTSGTRNQLCESDNAFRTGTEKSSDSIRTNPEAIVRRESELIRERGDDIEAFIKYLNAKERVSEQERENREVERSGFGAKGKCEAEKPKRKIIEKKR